MRITDFTIKSNGLADIVDRGFKQKLTLGLWILNYFAYGLSFLVDVYFADPDLTVNYCGLVDFGLNLGGSKNLPTSIRGGRRGPLSFHMKSCDEYKLVFSHDLT